MQTVVIYCKDCKALFYATMRIEPADALDIAKYARQGHRVAIVDAAVVRTELATCTCDRDSKKGSPHE